MATTLQRKLPLVRIMRAVILQSLDLLNRQVQLVTRQIGRGESVDNLLRL